MPYPGVPQSKTTAVERCVNRLMADPKFKPKKGRTKKQSAIAICVASITSKKVINCDMNDKINIFAEITKVDKDKRMIEGYASTETLDSQGEIVSRKAITDALDGFMEYANVREMHQPSAVGVVKTAKIDEKGLHIKAKIVDDNAWNKVKEGVYKGFSIGGQILVKKSNKILQMMMNEVSVVDRPANPDAKFSLIKMDQKELSGLAKAIGYTPWWAKNNAFRMSLINKADNINMDIKEILTKKPDELSDKEKAFLAENESELTDEQKAEFGVGEKPEAKEEEEEKKDEEKETEKPEEKKEEEAKEEEAKPEEEKKESVNQVIDNAITKLQSLKQEKKLSKSEVAIKKVVANEMQSHLAKVEGMIGEAINPIKELVEKIANQPARSGPMASFIVNKGEEDDGKGNAEKTAKVEKIRGKIEDLKKKRESMSVADYQREYGDEANNLVTELRRLVI